MRAKLTQIGRKVRTLRAKLGKVKLAKLPLALRQYAQDGECPTDPLAAAYLRLTEASQAAMGQSIGGPDHEQACKNYQEKLATWRATLKQQGL